MGLTPRLSRCRNGMEGEDLVRLRWQATPSDGIGEVEESRARVVLAHKAVTDQRRERRGCPFSVVVFVSLCMIQTI